MTGEDDSMPGAESRLRAASGRRRASPKPQREPHTSIAKVESDRSRKNSRVKGSRAELDVARMFTDWCGESVRRTPLSGGWSNARFGVTADLVCANAAFPFSVEIKHREGWALDDLVTGARREHDKSIRQWWIQCVRSCPKTADADHWAFHKEPLLVFRRNHQPWLAMMRGDLVDVEAYERRGVDVIHALVRGTEIGDTAVVVLKLADFLAHALVPDGLTRHQIRNRRGRR